MKLAIAALVVFAVGAVAAIAVAVHGTNDDTPNQVRDCLEKTDALVVHGEDGLSGLRRDLVLKTPPRRTQLRGGDSPAVGLEGTGYRVLVLGGRKSPPLTGDIATRVYRHADAYPLVAIEPAASSGMIACARTAK